MTDTNNLASEVLRLTAANAALTVRVEEAREIIKPFLEWWPAEVRMQPPEAIAARAWLAGKAGAE